jgi:hypothetical protein
MKQLSNLMVIFVLGFAAAIGVRGQVDEICADAGYMPSLDPPRAQIPYIFGRISLQGFEANSKLPNITVTMVDGQQAVHKMTLGRSGNYCFKVRNRGGTLIVEVGGVEMMRRALPLMGPSHLREDFELHASREAGKSAPPGVISAKFYHPPNSKTAELYKKTAEAEGKNDQARAIEYLKEIVTIDPADFIAWAKLGFLYQEKGQLMEANAAYQKALELKIEYTPAWINAGILRVTQKQYEAAIEIFKHAATLEPKSARIYQLLGETYLQARQGTLGAEALNKAIELDPVGMAECHLRLAQLYHLAKANQLATKEYKMFLAKVPDYKDKKKLEEFIKKNPD